MGQPLSERALVQRYRRLRDCWARALAGGAPRRDLAYYAGAMARVRRECLRHVGVSRKTQAKEHA